MISRTGVRCLLVLLLSASICQGCGLVFQGTRSTVKITTDPPGALIRVDGTEGVSPVSVTLSRRRSASYVARISSEGYRDTCRVVKFKTNRFLVVLDSIPLALGLAVDGIARTWPGRIPRSVHVPLERESETDYEPLPSDQQLLMQSRMGPYDPCMLPRAVIPKSEKHVALYLLRLASVDVDGQRLASVREDAAGPLVKVIAVDEPVQLEITPRHDLIDLRLLNKSSSSIKVRWEDAVFVDFDQTSNPIGRRGFDYGPFESDGHSVVAPGTAIEKSVFSRNRVYEKTTPIEVTDQACAQSCGQLIYQCMAGYNCSGYRSRQPYTGSGWGLVALAEGIDAGLCERRCVDQGRACFRGCGRVVEQSEGLAHLDVVPALVRKCSLEVADFERDAEQANAGSYGVLLPIDVAGRRREYMLRFQPYLSNFLEDTDCSLARAKTLR